MEILTVLYSKPTLEFRQGKSMLWHFHLERNTLVNVSLQKYSLLEKLAKHQQSTDIRP